MDEKSTEEMDHILENTKPGNIEDFFEDNKKSLVEPDKEFYYFMKNTIDDKGIKLKDVYSFAGVSESYGGQILRMEKHSPNRDLIIRLCIAGRLNVNEINKALKLYGFNGLYSKDGRDACIIVAIHNRKYNMSEIDDMLIEQGFQKLTIDE